MTDALFGPLPKSPRDLGEFFVSEIQPLLETLRGLPESQGPLNDRPPKDHLLEDLTRWLCREGVSLDGLRLEADAGLGSKGMGSGVFATKSFGVCLWSLRWWELSLSIMYTRTRRVCCRQEPSSVLFLDG